MSSPRPAPDGGLPAPCEPRLRAHGWAGLAGSIAQVRACVRVPGALTWEMTSLKDDLNSCTSVVNRLTSCPVFLASKKAMSCLAVGHGGSRWERGRRHLRTRPHLQTLARTPGAPGRPAPAPCSWQYRSRLLKRALRMSTAMRSPMRDSSTRYPKVSRPWERGGALRGARGDCSLCAQALPPAVPGGHRG